MEFYHITLKGKEKGECLHGLLVRSTVLVLYKYYFFRSYVAYQSCTVRSIIKLLKSEGIKKLIIPVFPRGEADGRDHGAARLFDPTVASSRTKHVSRYVTSTALA